MRQTANDVKITVYFTTTIVCCVSMLLVCSPYLKLSSPRATVSDFQESIASIPEKWSDEPIIILSDSTCMRFLSNENGTVLSYKETIVFYVNKQVPNIIGTLPVYENVIIEKPPKTTVTVFYPDGSVWNSLGSQSERLPVQSTIESVSNKYVGKISVPKYIEGMVVRQTVERTYTRPEFFTMEMVGKMLPVLNRSIELITPDSAKIVKQLLNESGLSVATAENVVKGERVTTFSAKAIDKTGESDDFKEAERNLAVVYISFPPAGLTSYSWRELGDNYLSLIQGAYTGDEKLKKYASSITTDNCDSVVRQSALLVRKRMRYLNYSEGVYAFVPHSLSSILSKGYGDCKDMGIVCQSIGRLHGCKVGLVLLNATDGFQPVSSVPSLAVFDHVALYFTSSKGERIVVDPTITYGKPLETGFYYIGKRALFLDSANSSFDTISEPSSYYNTVSTSSSLTYNKAAQAWEIKGTINLYGMTAMHLYMIDVPAGREKQLPLLKKYLKRFFELDIQEGSIKRLSPDTIVMEYAAPFQDNYVSLSKGGFVLNKPSLFGGHIRYTTLTYTGPRYFASINQMDSWRVPRGFRILEKKNLATAIAEGAWTIRKHKVSRRFKQKRVVVGNDDARSAVSAKETFSKATVWKK